MCYRPLHMYSMMSPICKGLVVTTFSKSLTSNFYAYSATCMVIWWRLTSVSHQNSIQPTVKAKKFTAHAPVGRGSETTTYLEYLAPICLLIRIWGSDAHLYVNPCHLSHCVKICEGVAPRQGRKKLAKIIYLTYSTRSPGDPTPNFVWGHT